MTNLAPLNAALPSGLSAREQTDADLPAAVELQNRHAPETEQETAEGLRRWQALSPTSVHLELVVAGPDGAIVAVAGVSDGGIFRSADGTHRAGVLVDRAWRGRGIGAALLPVLEERALATGAPAITTRVRGDEPEAMRFATARGYLEFHRRYNAYLDLAAFDSSRFDDPDAIARRAGVELVTLEDAWTGAADTEALLREVHDLNSGLLQDVPRPDAFVAPPLEATRTMLGSPTLDRRATLLARAAGQVVGLTLSDVNEVGLGYTFMTGVESGRRGKGLALALKLRAIDALRRRGVRWFGTTNDEANAPMRAVNRRLGYVTAPAWIQVRKELR